MMFSDKASLTNCLPASGVRRLWRLFQIMVPVASALACCPAAADEEEIVSDRPDFVESSTVVGAGRFQIETGVEIGRNRIEGIRESVITTPTLLRFGISHNWELRVESDGRTVFRSEEFATGARERASGYADLAAGVKWHVLDAEGRRPSVGILGHVDTDSGSREFRGRGYRPSIRVAAEWELPGDMSLGIMPGLRHEKSSAGKRYAAGIFGVTLGKAWAERFRTFIEVAAPQIARGRNGGTLATFDVGGVYLLPSGWQIDTGVFKGLNERTTDLSWTVGVSAKF